MWFNTSIPITELLDKDGLQIKSCVFVKHVWLDWIEDGNENTLKPNLRHPPPFCAISALSIWLSNEWPSHLFREILKLSLKTGFFPWLLIVGPKLFDICYGGNFITLPSSIIRTDMLPLKMIPHISIKTHTGLPHPVVHIVFVEVPNISSSSLKRKNH